MFDEAGYDYPESDEDQSGLSPYQDSRVSYLTAESDRRGSDHPRAGRDLRARRALPRALGTHDVGTYVLPWMVSHHFMMRVRVTRWTRTRTG